MRVVLLCATRRGYLVLRKLADLLPEARLVVCSFREEPWEPPFLDDIRALTAERAGEFFETRRVESADMAPFWESTEVELMLAVSWRYMIPASIYQRPRMGTFVFHDALLPRYRGFSPTVWAIVNGEDHTGVTLFEIADEVDAGDVVDQARVPIGPEESIGVVMERVTQMYLTLLERNLAMLLDGSAPHRPQDHARATFTRKRVPEDNRIEWDSPSAAIHNLIRAVAAPYSGAYTSLAGGRLRVWSAERLPGYDSDVGRTPGRIVEVRPREGSVVLTRDSALLLKRVQTDTGDVVCAAEVLDTTDVTLGMS
jgi:methionyl-tRNA formyltransferase